MSYFKERGSSLACVIANMFAVAAFQGTIAYTMTFGALRGILWDFSWLVTKALYLRFALCAVMALLWVLKRKWLLIRLIVLSNGFFTLVLISHTSSLIAVLFGGVSEAVNALIFDVVLMASTNVLIFSIWYWLIEERSLGGKARSDRPWQFLFPQRGARIPRYESWVPHYTDYLFIAFTTSFAFSPTDTLPLSRRAKVLMMLQASISVVSLTGIAGSAINILAGRP